MKVPAPRVRTEATLPAQTLRAAEAREAEWTAPPAGAAAPEQEWAAAMPRVERVAQMPRRLTAWPLGAERLQTRDNRTVRRRLRAMAGPHAPAMAIAQRRRASATPRAACASNA